VLLFKEITSISFIANRLTDPLPLADNANTPTHNTDGHSPTSPI
jgi:hypothetical protein